MSKNKLEINVTVYGALHKTDSLYEPIKKLVRHDPNALMKDVRQEMLQYWNDIFPRTNNDFYDCFDRPLGEGKVKIHVYAQLSVESLKLNGKNRSGKVEVIQTHTGYIPEEFDLTIYAYESIMYPKDKISIQEVKIYLMKLFADQCGPLSCFNHNPEEYNKIRIKSRMLFRGIIER